MDFGAEAAKMDRTVQVPGQCEKSGGNGKRFLRQVTTSDLGKLTFPGSGPVELYFKSNHRL
jgi:hypothetical protein